MKWRRRRRSSDVEIRRGGAGGLPIPAAGAVGIPALFLIAVVVLIANVVGGSGFDAFDDVLDDLNGPQQPAQGQPLPTDTDAKLVDFLKFVHGDVQTFWEGVFADSARRFERATLVLFDTATQSGCGLSTADIGPHYCPVDANVYLDLDFFRELRSSFGAPGDFAQAYVLAHELGHHVQNILGIMSDVRRAQQEDPSRTNELSIRLELQADCFAGVWAFSTFERNLLESGDLEEGLRAAASVGDDRIQEKATGMVNPETWTHGSSEQRTQWFRRGFDTGDPNACDTFSVDQP